MITTIKPLENEGFDVMLTAVNTLSDECVDTYFALIALALEFNGTDRLPQRFQVTIEDILSICGKKKHHGSYDPGVEVTCPEAFHPKPGRFPCTPGYRRLSLKC
jgi:hypothetical protein